MSDNAGSTKRQAPPKVEPPKTDPPPKGEGAPAVDPAEAETLRAELAKYKKREEDAAKAKAKADEDAAKQRGEFEKLYGEEKGKRETLETEVAGYREREEKRLKAVEERNKARLKELGDDARELVKDAGLTGEALADYLDKHWKRLTGDVERPAGGQRGTGGGGERQDTKGVPDAIVAEAARRKMDAAKLWKLVQKHDPKRAQALTVEN